MIFNGEIYNYRELRAELQGKGHQFRTNSDTEVIIHGYKEWGTDVFNHLNGMFGLAIWDVPNERLVLARDAMGIKLVYYRIDNGQLTFGSEIRAISRAENSTPDSRSRRAQSLPSFSLYAFSFDDLSRHSETGAGPMLIVEDGQCREERWYDYTPIPFSSPKADEEAMHELLAIVSGSGSTASAERRASRNTSQRRARLGLAPGADERTRRPLAGLHGGLWRKLRRRRTG